MNLKNPARPASPSPPWARLIAATTLAMVLALGGVFVFLRVAATDPSPPPLPHPSTTAYFAGRATGVELRRSGAPQLPHEAQVALSQARYPDSGEQVQQDFRRGYQDGYIEGE